MVDAWPNIAEDPSVPDFMINFANTLNPMKKIVVSKTLEKVGWNTKLMKELNFQELKRMKDQPGKNIAIGGANLAQQLMQHDLIDEFQLLFHPVVLGSGKPLFYGKKLDLELLKAEKFDSGVVMLNYRLKKK